MLGKNPLRVQSAPAGQFRKSTPLVLIHDGGGTTFGYFSLGSLYRDVWAVHNPHFFTAQPWEGGMDEMARHYIDLIEAAGITGQILLGGWSLGGYLSVAIARMLAVAPSANLSIAGLLLIDSPFHIPRCKLPPTEADPDLGGLPDLVKKSLDACDDLLQTWDLPGWNGSATVDRAVPFTVGAREFVAGRGSVPYKSIQDGWRNVETPTFMYDGGSRDDPAGPPPAVMLRCAKYRPPKVASSEPCRIDMFRSDPLLGWADNYPDFVKAVIDTDADHYKLFEMSRVREVTQQLNECLDILEKVKAV